jgi:hypothetical protein
MLGASRIELLLLHPGLFIERFEAGFHFAAQLFNFGRAFS